MKSVDIYYYSLGDEDNIEVIREEEQVILEGVRDRNNDGNS